MKRALIALMTLALAVTAALAQDRWLHITVEEYDGDDHSININMPLSAVGALLSNSEVDELRNGKLDFGDHASIDGVDLREILTALRDAPDSDFITIRSREDRLRVAKEDGFLLVNIDETHGDRVRVRMPMEVVEILLDTEDDELDVVRLLDALAVLDGDDLITVDSDDSRIRIWIDSYSTAD